MTLQYFGRAAAVAILLDIGGMASASDPAPAPLPTAAGPVLTQGSGPCPTCQGTAPGTCQTCKQNPFGLGKKGKPYETHLCPGACFGYFPTQWHKWEEVCPIPYPGHGLSDAPRIPTPPLTGAPTTTTIPPPKTPVDPKTLPDPKTPKSNVPVPNPLPLPDPKKGN